MRLSEIHAAIEAGQGPALPENQTFATLVAIEHLAQIEGIPVSALDFAAPRFGAKYTFRFSDLRGSWRGPSNYLAWRNLILNVQLLFAPGDVEADPWASLGRAERLWKKNVGSDFGALYLSIPTGTHPREITDALLAKVNDTIPAEIAPRLRAGLYRFRQLFQNDLALRTGLLPDVCPKPLRSNRNHRWFSGMSPEIEAWRNGLSDPNIKRALDYLNRLAIAAGRLNGKTDTLDALCVALCDLPSPKTVNVPSVSKKSLCLYEKDLRRGLGCPDPRKSPAEHAWADLWTAARTAGCKTSHLGAVSRPAAARGLFPTEVSEAVALEILVSYNTDSRSLYRRGCDQLDALRGKVSPDILPPSPLRIRRHTPHPTRESGLARAKAQGKALGRPSTLSADEQALVRARIADGETVSSIARDMGTSRQTIMRARDSEPK